MSSTEASYAKGANFDGDNESDAILTPDEEKLHAAARQANEQCGDEIMALVQGQAGNMPVDINSRNAYDRTALHWAAGNNNVIGLRTLIQLGAAVDAKDKFGMNALLWAAWFGHTQSLLMLVKAGAGTETKNKNGLSFLHCAATNDHVDVISVCQQELQDFDIDSKDEHGRSALHIAARNGQVQSVVTLIDLKSDINLPDKNGETPLHLASKHGHTKAATSLIEYGADTSITAKDEQTALHVACGGGHTDIVRKLLEHGANADGVPIFNDSKEQTERTTSNIESGSHSAELSEESDNQIKCTRPIHLAAKHGSCKIIKLLADGGAHIDAVNEQKQCALHIATALSNLSAAQMLLAHAASANIRDNRNEAPLHLAAENGFNDMAEILLKSASDVRVRDGKGKTPLLVAARGNYVTIVDMIIKAERCHLLLKKSLTPTVLLKINFKPDSSPETQFIRSLLYKLSTKYLRRNEWKLLCTYWKFSETQVRAIEEQWIGEKSYREHAHRMLLIWLHGCLLSKQNPIKGIFEALCHIERRDLAEQMRTKANQGPNEDKSCSIQ